MNATESDPFVAPTIARVSCTILCKYLSQNRQIARDNDSSAASLVSAEVQAGRTCPESLQLPH